MGVVIIRYRVTRYAGSVIVSGPTLTCPCSINFTAWKRFGVSQDTPRQTRRTNRADCLSHFAHHHNHGESAAAERRDSQLVLDVAQLGGRVEHAHVVKLGQQLPFHFCAERVLCWEHGEAVGERAEGAAQFVVPAQGRTREGIRKEKKKHGRLRRTCGSPLCPGCCTDA